MTIETQKKGRRASPYVIELRSGFECRTRGSEYRDYLAAGLIVEVRPKFARLAAGVVGFRDGRNLILSRRESRPPDSSRGLVSSLYSR